MTDPTQQADERAAFEAALDAYWIVSACDEEIALRKPIVEMYDAAKLELSNLKAAYGKLFNENCATLGALDDAIEAIDDPLFQSLLHSHAIERNTLTRERDEARAALATSGGTEKP